MIDSFSGDDAFLSNFFPSPIEWREKTWTTVEHAYQAAKALREEDAEKIRLAETPGRAKRLGRKVSLKPTWDSAKIAIMTRLVREKFVQNPGLRDRLLLTIGEELVEGNTWGDTFWGSCRGEGRNELGKILMLVREELSA